MRVVLSGGGTAGHINPALALSEVLKERGHEMYFAGTPDGVEATLVKDAGLPFTGFLRPRASTGAILFRLSRAFVA